MRNLIDVTMACEEIARKFPGVRLTGLEVPRDDHEAMLMEAKRKAVYGITVVTDGREKDLYQGRDTVLKINGVTITPVPLFVPPAIRKGLADMLDSHRGMDSGELAERLYREVHDLVRQERDHA